MKELYVQGEDLLCCHCCLVGLGTPNAWVLCMHFKHSTIKVYVLLNLYFSLCGSILLNFLGWPGTLYSPASATLVAGIVDLSQVMQPKKSLEILS